MKYLPRESAFGKLKAMVEGARRVRAELERPGRRNSSN
jgi:methionine synthase II (cobalamin-independent)